MYRILEPSKKTASKRATQISSEIDETPAEKKLRLAKAYISQLKEIQNDENIDQQIIEDKQDSIGRLFRPAATEMDGKWGWKL